MAAPNGRCRWLLRLLVYLWGRPLSGQLVFFGRQLLSGWSLGLAETVRKFISGGTMIDAL